MDSADPSLLYSILGFTLDTTILTTAADGNGTISLPNLSSSLPWFTVELQSQPSPGQDFVVWTPPWGSMFMDLTYGSNDGFGSLYSAIVSGPAGGATWTADASLVQNAPVPEPATILLLGTGLVGLAGSRIRKKRA